MGPYCLLASRSSFVSGPLVYSLSMEAAPVAVRLDSIVLLACHETVYTGHNQFSSLCLSPRVPPVPQRDRPKASFVYRSIALLDAYMS